MSLDADVPPQAIQVYRVFSQAGHGQGWVGDVHHEDMLDKKTCFELGRYGRHGIIDDELSSCIGRVESIGPGHYGRFIRREGIHSAAESHDAGDAAVEYATFTGKLRPALLAILLKTKRKQLY